MNGKLVRALYNLETQSVTKEDVEILVELVHDFARLVEIHPSIPYTDYKTLELLTERIVDLTEELTTT